MNRSELALEPRPFLSGRQENLQCGQPTSGGGMTIKIGTSLPRSFVCGCSAFCPAAAATVATYAIHCMLCIHPIRLTASLKVARPDSRQSAEGLGCACGTVLACPSTSLTIVALCFSFVLCSVPPLYHSTVGELTKPSRCLSSPGLWFHFVYLSPHGNCYSSVLFLLPVARCSTG